MHLRKLKIQNFRSIQNIETNFEKLVSVIIGPNAVGKTTILEAIRLAKAVLAPRTQNESIQILNSLGVTSPFVPNVIFYQSLTKNKDIPTSINLEFDLSEEEIQHVKNMNETIVIRLALSGAGLVFSNPAQAMNFLQSQQGQEAIKRASNDVKEKIPNIINKKLIQLNLNIDHKSNSTSSDTILDNQIFSVFEQKLPPAQSLFSYFPADRAMPSGEQQVQFGLQDTSQQLESHNSQPQLKFSRLKNTIFSTIISQENGRQEIEDNFKRIFGRILKGRELGQIGINELGMLKISIKDTEAKIEFDIDGLSSGEKGLILTFLLIAKTIARNGIILLDEPELHLNPAVCRDLLQFFIDEYAKQKNIQAIICSHSTEILAGALEREQESTLFHLRSGTSLAEIRRHDNTEIREALARLGTSEIETLLYLGSVFVEGVHDLELLRVGFDDIFRRYKLNDLGGRGSIEKNIKTLQKNEKNNEINGIYYFIFDEDSHPTSLESSNAVKLLQLPVYCIENLLIDCNIITDITRNKDFSCKQINTVTDCEDQIKEIAFSQLDAACALLTFKKMGFENIKFDISKFKNSTKDNIISEIINQINSVQNIIGDIDKNFKQNFEEIFDSYHRDKSKSWDKDWIKLCNGKLLFENMHKKEIFHCSPLNFKKEIMTRMKNAKSENWNKMRKMFEDFLRVADS